MVSEPLLWPFLSSPVFISVTLFFFSTSLPPSQQPPQPFDVIQPSSLGSGPTVAVVKEFHTAQTTAARITVTNIASITVLKLPQRSSCADLQNRESLNAVEDHTRPHTPLKVSVRLITRSTRLQAPLRAYTCRHAPPSASTRLHAPVSPTNVSLRWRHLPCHLLTSSATASVDVIVDQDVDQTVDLRWLDRWLWLYVDFDLWLFAIVDFLQSKCSLPSFSRRFHFCSIFLHILLLNEE